MNAHVLLNLLNELAKSDRKRRLPSILSLFRNELIMKCNNTGAWMLDSTKTMTLKLLKKSQFWGEHVKILPYFTQS